MLAALGYIMPEIRCKFPGYLFASVGLKLADALSSLAVITKVPAARLAQILAHVALCEVLHSAKSQKLSAEIWSPVFFVADGSLENFQRRRTELEQGRIHHILCQLSQKAGEKFSDAPDGLAALLSRRPAHMWA